MTKLSEYAAAEDKNFRELSLDEYHRFCTLFGQDVYDITLESSVAARNTVGGTSPQQVAAALTRAARLLENEGGKQTS
jgi:argininosuccinate lyase